MNRKEEILAECLDDIQHGRCTAADCLRRYPEFGSELKDLLEIAVNIKPANASPAPAFRQQLRSRIFEEPVKAGTKTQEHHSGWFFPLISVRAAAFGLLAFVVLAGSAGSAYASQSSLPGDVLYPVKLGMEQVEVAVTHDPEQKAYLYLKLAQRRIDEVAAEVSLNRTPAASILASIPEKTDAALREIEKAPNERAGAFLTRFVETTTNQQIILGEINAGYTSTNAVKQAMTSLQRANLIADAAYNNTAFLKTSPSVREDIEKGRFQVEGELISVTGSNWNVGGVILTNVHFSGSLPKLNSLIKIDAINKNGDVFVINLEVKDSPPATVTIQGPFTGTDKSGKVWYVGDTPIDAPTGKTPPAEGKNLEVKGITSNSSLTVHNVTESEGRGKVEGKGAKMEGRIESVNVPGKTMTIKVAGAGITLDISNAKITGEDEDKSLTIGDLSKMVGKRVKIDGVVKKDGTIFAKEIEID